MLVLLLMKKCFSNRADELASKVKASRQKLKSLTPHLFLSGLFLEVPPTFRGGFPSSENVIRELSYSGQCQGACLLIDSRPRQVDNQD